jgi:hypothetical protein
MATAVAEVRTDRPSRYLVQLCRHASQLSRHRFALAHLAGEPKARQDMPAQIEAEWSDTHGVLSIDGGRCTLRATSDTLILRAEAGDEDTLHRLQGLIASNLTRFSRRDPLTVTWHRQETPDVTSDAAPTPAGPVRTRRTRHRTLVLLVAGALAIAAHVVLGGAVLAAPQWTGWAANAVLVVVVVKAAAIGVGYLAHRRRKAANTR